MARNAPVLQVTLQRDAIVVRTCTPEAAALQSIRMIMMKRMLLQNDCCYAEVRACIYAGRFRHAAA